MAKDCPKGFAICFHCNQTGHQKAKCPQLQGSATATVRATESRPVKAEELKARGRAFQLCNSSNFQINFSLKIKHHYSTKGLFQVYFKIKIINLQDLQQWQCVRVTPAPSHGHH